MISLLDAPRCPVPVSSALLQLSVGLGDHDDIVVLVYQALHKQALQRPKDVAQVLDTMPAKMMARTHHTRCKGPHRAQQRSRQARKKALIVCRTAVLTEHRAYVCLYCMYSCRME